VELVIILYWVNIMDIRRYLDIIREAEVADKPKVAPPEVAPTEVPLHVPGGATVVILNDKVTPFEVVVEAIMHGTGLAQDEAVRRMMQAHHTGWAPVASYASRDVAETVANKIETHARNNTKYDHYRRLNRHQGPWPLAAEVMDAGQ
jgi:ATP-dependent Clp protease adapter protein ClpS